MNFGKPPQAVSDTYFADAHTSIHNNQPIRLLLHTCGIRRNLVLYVPKYFLFPDSYLELKTVATW